MRHLISILLLLVLAVPAAAGGYLPEHCAKLEHPPPDFFECPSPYVEMTRSGKGKIFSRAWHCRETKHSLGVNRYGGCGGSKGLAMFPGWTVPVAAATAKPPQVDLSLVCKEYPSPTVSYRTLAQIRRIARDTVKSMGLKVGPLDVLPTDKKRQWYWAASGFSGLNVLSRNMDWTWFVDGDTVRFRKRSDTSQVRIYKTLDARLQIADSNMEVEIETDFPATTEITIATERVYERKDQDGKISAYSNEYFSKCGTVAQWAVNKVHPIDEAAWTRGLKEHQDNWSLLGKDMAFEIVAVDDHITVSTTGGLSQVLTDEDRVLKPRATAGVLGSSELVAGSALESGRTYRLRRENIPLMGSFRSHGTVEQKLKDLADMLYLPAGTLVRVVDVVDDSGTPSYRVTLPEYASREGWINSIALLREGAQLVSETPPAATSPKPSGLRAEVWDKVIDPCILQIVRNQGGVRGLTEDQAVNFAKTQGREDWDKTADNLVKAMEGQSKDYKKLLFNLALTQCGAAPK